MMQQHRPLDHVSGFFRSGSVLSRLILANIAVFLVVHLTGTLLWLLNLSEAFNPQQMPFLVYWFSVPADLSQLAARPWGVFSYMFLHEGFLHLLFNMILLFFGGQLFLMLLNSRKLLSTYLLGGVTGALFFIVSYNLFPVFETARPGALAIGASASVLSVLIAAATFAPNFEVTLLLIGRIKLKYIALILVLIDLMSISRGNPGGHLAHLGGAAWGFMYIRLFLGKGTAFNRWVHTSSGRKKNPFGKRPARARVVSDEEYNEEKAKKQQQIDRILEKISRKGYDGLTQEEKEILFRAGRK